MKQTTKVDGVRIEDVEAIDETGRALRCLIEGEEAVWIPKSHITDDSEVFEKGQTGTLVITEWIAKQKGLA